MRFYDGERRSSIASDTATCRYELSLDIAIPAGRRLAHAHQAGIVHRDVKPGMFC
jgi:serine/threonine protein kinase